MNGKESIKKKPTQIEDFKLSTARNSRNQRPLRDNLLIEKKVSAKVIGKISNAKKTLSKTVPKPFALSTSKRHNVSIVVDDVSSKDEYVPLKAQVDNFFDKDLRQSSSENSDSL